MTLNVEELPPQEASSVKELVRASHFFQQPSQEDPPRGADLQKYILTVEDRGNTHTLVLCDPIADPELRALVDYLRSKR